MGVLSILRGVATASLAGLAIAGGLLYAFQSKLIYPANLPSGSRTTVATPDEHGMPDYEEVTLTTPDGVKIRAFVVLYRGESAGIRPTVLLLHANAGNVGHRLPIARIFNINMRANVVALSYRGYGKSEGSASERGLRLDAQTAMDYILSHPKLEKTQIFLYGQSIGGAVAIDLAANNSQRIAGLIVENTFLSLPKLVPHVMPYLAPFMFLLHQRWPSDEKVKTFPPTLPVLFLSGSSDELIPPYHVAELCRLSGGKNRLIKFPHGTHNDTCMQPDYFPTIARFIDEIIRSPTSTNAPPPPVLSTPTSPVRSTAPSSTDGSFELIGEGEDSSNEGELIGGAMSTGNVQEILKEGLREKIHEVEEKLEKL